MVYFHPFNNTATMSEDSYPSSRAVRVHGPVASHHRVQDSQCLFNADVDTITDEVCSSRRSTTVALHSLFLLIILQSSYRTTIVQSCPIVTSFGTGQPQCEIKRKGRFGIGAFLPPLRLCDQLLVYIHDCLKPIDSALAML
jgi:hypothetical protein